MYNLMLQMNSPDIFSWLQEMEDVEHKLAFLNKRFEQADSIKWTGMFKKHPMW